MEKKMKIAVIGAGASGMAAAITAEKCGAEVTLFEKNERVGKKILSTGNGKCNLGNLEFSMEQYYCSDKEKLQNIFQTFSVWDTVSFFENMGLMIKNKNGYLYPYSEQASTVLDLLRTELMRAHVSVRTEVEIVSAGSHKENEGFELTDSEGNHYFFEKLILACGSPASLKKGEGRSGYELAAQLGHHISPLLPGLVQLKSDERFIRALSGVRCQAGVTLLIDGQTAAVERGELQFTDYGISGIPVFQFSRIAARALENGQEVKVMTDFFPDQDEKAFGYMTRLRYEAQKDKSLEDYLTGTLNKKICRVMIKQAGLQTEMAAEEAGWLKIKELMLGCRSFEIHISETNSLENAQVCAGGVDFGEISTELESRIVKGLYFTGEMVDVDGKCGGYNLQWAWSSGYLAGRNAAGCPVEEISVQEDAPVC